MKNIDINFKQTQSEYILEVSLPSRRFARDEKLGFSEHDAEDFLREKNLKYSKITSGSGLILRNFGGAELTGTYIFEKEASKSKVKKPATPRRRTTKTKEKE